MAESKPTAHLDEWVKKGEVLMGRVSGHPLIPDGTEIVTSAVVEFKPEEGYAVTRNTRYKLGLKLDF